MNRFNIILMVVILILINSVLFIDIDKKHKLITLALIVVLSFTALHKTNNLNLNIENFQGFDANKHIIVSENVPSTISSCEKQTTIETITVGEGVTSIGDNAYCSQYNLHTVSLPKTIKSLGSATFFKAINLKTINLELTSITVVPEKCFSTCLSLENVKLPTTVNKIETLAFSTCLLLKSINLEELTNLGRNESEIPKAIGSGAFFICASLKNIRMPDHITNKNMREFVGQNAFAFDPNFISEKTYLIDLAYNVSGIPREDVDLNNRDNILTELNKIAREKIVNDGGFDVTATEDINFVISKGTQETSVTEQFQNPNEDNLGETMNYYFGGSIFLFTTAAFTDANI